MTSPEDDDPDEPMLPEPAVLEAWEVPMTTPELTDRIMARLDELPADVSTSARAPAAGSWRAGGLGWAVVGVGMVAAAALVLTLVRPTSEPPAEPPPSAAVTQPSATPAPAAAPVATLVVRTEPSDARVEVDGIPVAGPSPFTIAGLKSGAHRIVVERDGFLPVERTVEGGVGMELPIELPRRDVVLAISVEPPEASVRLWAEGEGVEIGSDGDRYSLRREAGVAYEVEASAPGYIARRIPLPLSPDADQEVRLSLVPDPSAPSQPPPTAVKRPRSPDLDDPFASSKPRRIRDLKDPFASRSEDEAEPGRLRIGTEAGVSPAVVFIDGKRKGMTPLMNVKVSPGRHKVEFRFPDGTVDVMMVKIGAGETKTIKTAG